MTAAERFAADIAAMSPQERALLLQAIAEAEDNRQDTLTDLLRSTSNDSQSASGSF
jgi:acyl-CoA reductase-like NAD-dependent aldehyde dehydrogenase